MEKLPDNIDPADHWMWAHQMYRILAEAQQVAHLAKTPGEVGNFIAQQLYLLPQALLKRELPPRIVRERGEHGLIYASSPEIPGLFVAAETLQQIEQILPQAIADLKRAGQSKTDT